MAYDEDLVYLNAAEALDLFKRRQLSPVELMQALIDRAAITEPGINALCAQFPDEALAKAKKAEDRYMQSNGRLRPLEGLPLAVKDDTPVKGRRTTMGSLICKDQIDEQTNPSVERLLRAGAILHARTTCPEFCWAWVCYSRIHGVTRNPWNTEITPGGSSGGAAAALAAGSAMLATGSDSAGSIRQPAALCGVAGYKPPYGRNPGNPDDCFDFYLQIGPMARSVEDCALMQNVMAGPHPMDHATVKPKLRLPWPPQGVEGLRIATSMDLGCHVVATDVRRNTDAALETLRGLGAIVEEIDMDWAATAIAAAGHFGDHLYADDFEDAVTNYPDLVTDYMPYYAEQVAAVSRRDLHEGLRVAGWAWQHFGTVFRDYNAFICPTVATTHVGATMPPWQEGFAIDGQPVDPSGAWVMTILFNMFSRCPVLAVPSGLADNGVPTGIQIVGRTFDDPTVFRIAAALEAEDPWYIATDKRPEF